MTTILGLDVSKATIDACLLDERGEASKKVSNNAKGFSQLKHWLTNRRAKNVQVCMEATGSYYEDVAESFADDGYLVSVVNPAQIKAFADSLLSRTKTDAVDAKIIAQFGRSQEPPAWTPPSPKERKLRGLVRFCGNLKETRASYEVQRQTPNLIKEVGRSIDELIVELDEQIATVEAEIAALINGDPDLRKRHRLLKSIDGVGDTTSSLILSEIRDLEDFPDAKAVAAFAGLSPRSRCSGTSVRGRGAICKTGSSRLRAGLWWPAITAMRHNPKLRLFAQRLRDAGKPNKKIIVAVMRKLLVLAYGVLKTGRPFDGALTAA
jgi:transposase